MLKKLIVLSLLCSAFTLNAQTYYEDESMTYEEEAMMDEEASFEGVREPGGEFDYPIQEQEYDWESDELYHSEELIYPEEEVIQ